MSACRFINYVFISGVEYKAQIRGGDNILTNEEKAAIILSYIEAPLYSAAAKKCGTSAATVKKVISATPYINELVAIHKSSCMSAGAFLKEKQAAILGVINKCLAILNDDDKLQAATLPQIASAMGTLLDKFVLSDNEAVHSDSDPLSEGLYQLAMDLKSDNIKEQNKEE